MRILKISIATAAAIVSLFTPITPASAESSRPCKVDKPLLCHSLVLHNLDVDKFADRVYSDWDPSVPLVATAVEITAYLVKDGKVYDLKVETSSGSAQLDADCVQAVLGASASGSINIGEGELWKHRFVFEPNKVGHKKSGIAQYFAAHPEEGFKCVAFYRIPLDVLKRYPGLFTEDELLGDENIGTITASAGDRPALFIRAASNLNLVYLGMWTPFFTGFPSPTKQQILEFRDKLPCDNRHPQ